MERQHGPMEYRVLIALCGLLTASTGGALTIAANLAFGRISEIEQESRIIPRLDERVRVLERQITELKAELNRHEREDHR